MQAYLLVFLGGGLGSICRFALAQLLREHSAGLPWATFAANALSCILLGVLLSLSLRNGLSLNTKFLLMTGFCGGFSTFSTFTAETYDLFLAGHTGYAFANIAGSLVICLFCIFLGITVGEMVKA